MVPIKSSEITPEHVYLSRRKFLQAAGLLAANAVLIAACGRQPAASPTVTTTSNDAAPLSTEMDELGNPLTPLDVVQGYSNYYEFTLNPYDVAGLSQGFVISPWQVAVGGLVNKPKTFDIDDLRAFEQEERIYRMRCVEAWAMVIPWFGFPLSRLLKEVEPLSTAKYVRFETLYDPDQMPGQKSQSFPWPYIEGLRLDEAMHDLTLLATGLYGSDLRPQNGAPVRLVVPWKYGFKSIKSIVKIDLVEAMPQALWMVTNPREYGFWANVNPEVPHPRWSQATERRIGESGRRETLFLNGYADEVAGLYPDPDSREWYY